MFRNVAVLGLAVSACGGSTADPPTAAQADSVAVPACSWSTVAGCGAVRGYLSCTDPAGDGMECPTDDLKNCRDTAGPMVSGGPWTCHDQCQPMEYSLSCGGIGPSAPSGNPPSACRFAGAIPAGIAFYCCPCGS